MGAGKNVKERGRLIVIEGIDGSGKSTQARLLAQTLKNEGREVTITREPGGSPMSEALRGVALDTAHDPLWETTVLLMMAARSEHIDKTIEPALKAGQWVVCDRMSDSTRAYQGLGQKDRIEKIRTIEEWVWGKTPRGDITVVIDIEVEDARKRREARNRGEDRIEHEVENKLETLRRSFLEIATEHRQNTVVVNGKGDTLSVHERVKKAIRGET